MREEDSRWTGIEGLEFTVRVLIDHIREFDKLGSYLNKKHTK